VQQLVSGVDAVELIVRRHDRPGLRPPWARSVPALVAMHFEDLKDGRAFADAARRVSRHKPVVVLKAGRTAAGAKAARSHTVVTPTMMCAELVADLVAEYRRYGIHKPVAASLSGDVEVEAAGAYLFEHGVAAYPYTTELPVAVLGAKYRWARYSTS